MSGLGLGAWALDTLAFEAAREVALKPFHTLSLGILILPVFMEGTEGSSY